VMLGEVHLGRGELETARRLAREALRIQPDEIDGLVLMGAIHLREGEVEDAREHAIWALRQNPADEGALGLMAGIKARESKLLGLWWRYNTFMGELGDGRSIVVLLGAFVLYRLASIFVTNEWASTFLTYGWYGICAYTWIGPAFFQRALEKELETVALDEDF